MCWRRCRFTPVLYRPERGDAKCRMARGFPPLRIVAWAGMTKHRDWVGTLLSGSIVRTMRGQAICPSREGASVDVCFWLLDPPLLDPALSTLVESLPVGYTRGLRASTTTPNKEDCRCNAPM